MLTKLLDGVIVFLLFSSFMMVVTAHFINYSQFLVLLTWHGLIGIALVPIIVINFVIKFTESKIISATTPDITKPSLFKLINFIYLLALLSVLLVWLIIAVCIYQYNFLHLSATACHQFCEVTDNVHIMLGYLFSVTVFIYIYKVLKRSLLNLKPHKKIIICTIKSRLKLLLKVVKIIQLI